MALPRRKKGPPLIDKHHPAFLVRPTVQLARKPDAWFRSEAYLAYVRGFPCRVCGRTQFIAAAHLWKGTDGAKKEKPSDIFTNPLCDGFLSNWTIIGCHDKQHRGEVSFWAQHVPGGVDAIRQEALERAAASSILPARAAALNVLAGRDWRGEA